MKSHNCDRNNSDPNASDLTLVQAIAAGDSRALHSLYSRHGLAILSYLHGQLDDPQLAEEILQDVMLAVWNGAARFRGESQVRTWMLSIARHHAINARQRRQIPQESLDDETKNDPSLIGTIGNLPDQQVDDQQIVQGALAHLPAIQRETLELIFYHNLSGPEAAAVLKVPVGTVKSRLHRALTTLRQLLIKEDIQP